MNQPTEPREIKAGDWVRFYQNGTLVIGIVQYRSPRKTYEQSDSLFTDIGATTVDVVLEVRHAD